MITGLVEVTVVVIFDHPNNRLQARGVGFASPLVHPDSEFWAARPIRRAVAVATVAGPGDMIRGG